MESQRLLVEDNCTPIAMRQISSSVVARRPRIRLSLSVLLAKCQARPSSDRKALSYFPRSSGPETEAQARSESGHEEAQAEARLPGVEEGELLKVIVAKLK